MDNSELVTATAFVELSSNPAFRDIMAYLESEVLRAKGIAVTAESEEPTESVRRKIIAWQEREKVLLGIQHMIEEQAEVKKAIEQEIENERAVQRERSSRTNW